MKKQQKNKKSGFTLVELVVVIAIIGILASVVVPRVRVAIYKARDAKAISVVDALRTAANIYYTEHGVTFATGTVVGTKTAIASGDIGRLQTNGLIDAKTAELVVSNNQILAGSITGCVTLTAGNITIGVNDGADIEITTSTNDASCSPWDKK